MGKCRKGPCLNQPAAATIDLHGYRKSEAISTLTFFLDEMTRKHKSAKELWVLVITGSGAHSPEGPVLRTAVQTLLEKRKMTFTVNRGGGSLLVQANSGFALYKAEPPTDTKILVRNSLGRPISLPKPGDYSGLHTIQNNDPTPREVAATDSALEQTLPKPGDYSGLHTIQNNDPTPREVAATDSALEQSREQYQTQLKEKRLEEKEFQSAVTMSILEEENSGKEETKELERALSASLLEQEPDEDELLRQALEQSKLESYGAFEEEEEQLRLAIESSKIESTPELDEFHVALERSRMDLVQE